MKISTKIKIKEISDLGLKWTKQRFYRFSYEKSSKLYHSSLIRLNARKTQKKNTYVFDTKRIYIQKQT